MSENETMINDEIPSFTTSEPKVTDTEKYTYNYSQSNKIHLAGPVEQAVIDYTNVIKMKNLCNTVSTSTCSPGFRLMCMVARRFCSSCWM